MSVIFLVTLDHNSVFKTTKLIFFSVSDKETFDREDKDDDDFLDEEELGNAIVESVE